MAELHLDDMALFVEVVRANSFTKAAARMAMPIATLSRRIAAMERRLGLRLFDRSTRRVTTTEAALRFFERCAPLVDEARLAHEALAARTALPEGHVRASMPVDLGVMQLGDSLPDFLRRYPGITLDLDFSSRVVDLKAEAFDVAFRLDPPRGDALLARRIGTIAQAPYAAPSYLDRCGRPRGVQDLKDHACLYIGSVRRGAVWRFSDAHGRQQVLVKGPVGLNSVAMMRRLAERGLGVAVLPDSLVAASRSAGRLERVLARHEMPGWPVFAVTTSRHQTAAVRAFMAFFAERLAAADQR